MRSPEAIQQQIARIQAARSVMMPDRALLAELDVQLLRLQGKLWQARTPEQVLASQVAERWLDGKSETEPAAEWEHLASLWNPILWKERRAALLA